MGVSLSGLVEPREISFEDLRGKAIAIDAYNTMYQFLSIIRDRFTGEPLRDSQGRVTSHLSGLFYRTSRMLDGGIKPIYVFDGKPPEFKRETIEARNHIRSEAERKWKAALEEGDTEKVRMYSQGAIRLSEEMKDSAKRLIECMGVQWIQAPSEGEAEAAYLARKGRVWASGSQDWDSLLFGAPKFVKNLTITGRRKIPRKESYVMVNPEIIELSKVLERLGIAHEKLIWLGILIGTDYNPGGIKGIGPKTALKMVKEKSSLNELLGQTGWEFATPAEKIEDFFKNPPVSDVEITKPKFRPERVLELMAEEHGFSRDRIESALQKMTDSHEKSKQKGLGSFLGN